MRVYAPANILFVLQDLPGGGLIARHHYERFAPMNNSRQAVTSGLQEFVVGTGGASKYGFSSILSASRTRNADTYGVLKLTLRPDGYDWNFIPVAGQSFTDRGSTLCQ